MVVRYGLPAAAVAALLILAGCATQPAEPVSLPAIEAASVAAAAPEPAPLIRERTVPVVTPVWLSEPDGETLARLYDLRPLGGGLCLVVNGGVSCDWRAK